MTRIEFHFNTADRLQYTCRLLRKAHSQSLRLGVVGSEATLRQLDKLLWTFSELDFLPHSHAQDVQGIQDASPIRLHADPMQLTGLDVLVNLGDEVPPGCAAAGAAACRHARRHRRQRVRTSEATL